MMNIVLSTTLLLLSWSCDLVTLALCVYCRLLQGVGCPDEVLSCVELGVDLFEGFFPFLVTERGCALNFDFNVNCDPESKGMAPPAGQEVYALTGWSYSGGCG